MTGGYTDDGSEFERISHTLVSSDVRLVLLPDADSETPHLNFHHSIFESLVKSVKNGLQ